MNNKYTITKTAEKTLRYIGETDGNAMELNCRRAVAEYALNGTLPEDKEISSRIAAIRFEIDQQRKKKNGSGKNRPKPKRARRRESTTMPNSYACARKERPCARSGKKQGRPRPASTTL